MLIPRNGDTSKKLPLTACRKRLRIEYNRTYVSKNHLVRIVRIVIVNDSQTPYETIDAKNLYTNN